MGKKSTANFHRKSSCDFQPESFRIQIDVGRAYRGWFAEHFQRWFVGSLDNPLLGCTVWCVSKKERKNGHLDYFLKIWAMDIQWWLGISLSFTQNFGYSGVTFARIPWSVVLFLLGVLVGLGADVGFTNSQYIWIHLGVSKNMGTPKWLIYNGKPY